MIDDGNGYRSEYVHLNEADVEAGQVVQAGDVIGLEGATGFATGCHLHYGADPHGRPLAADRLVACSSSAIRRWSGNGSTRLDVLPWGDPNAPQRLRDKVNPPSSTPISSAAAEPSPAAQPTDP